MGTTSGLTPADGKDVAIRIVALAAQYPETKLLTPEQVKIYVTALKEEPLWAIERTISRFLSGKVERKNRAFCPGPEEFSAEVASLTAQLRRNLVQERKVLETQRRIAPMPDPPSPEARERARKKVQEFGKSVEAASERKRVDWRNDPKYNELREFSEKVRRRLHAEQGNTDR